MMCRELLVRRCRAASGNAKRKIFDRWCYGWAACGALAWIIVGAATTATSQTVPPPAPRPSAGRPAPTAPARGAATQAGAGSRAPANAGTPGGRPAAGEPRTAAAPRMTPTGPRPGTPPGIAPQTAAPFQLSPQEQANLDRLLADWQEKSSRIKTLRCTFQRWEYDLVLNTVKNSRGELKYRSPDNALYRASTSGEAPWGDYWVCTGKSIFEYNESQKELIDRQLPPELQGKAIEDGPLPFLFNSDAAKLKRRYHLRLIPPPPGRQDEVWLEVYPKLRHDAANFQRAELILNAASDLLPSGVQIHMPNGQERTVHKFEDMVVNSLWEKLRDDFSEPRAPRGWTRRVEQAQPLVYDETAPQPPARVSVRPGGPPPTSR